MAVFCACMPNVRGFLAKIFPKNGFSRAGGSNCSKTWPARTSPASHQWEYSQGHASQNAPGGIRVTHLTSVTATKDENNTPRGEYYLLHDLGTVSSQFKVERPQLS